MANFRMERLFVMLDDRIPGLDHLKAVDAVEFAWHHSNQHAESLGVTPLDAFTYAPFQQPEWHDASECLATIRALRALYADWIAKGANPIGYTEDVLREKDAVLQRVEEVLDSADTLGRKFYLAARDLE